MKIQHLRELEKLVDLAVEGYCLKENLIIASAGMEKTHEPDQIYLRPYYVIREKSDA